MIRCAAIVCCAHLRHLLKMKSWSNVSATDGHAAGRSSPPCSGAGVTSRRSIAINLGYRLYTVFGHVLRQVLSTCSPVAIRICSDFPTHTSRSCWSKALLIPHSAPRRASQTAEELTGSSMVEGSIMVLMPSEPSCSGKANCSIMNSPKQLVWTVGKLELRAFLTLVRRKNGSKF